MGQRRAFQVGDDLLDDGVVAVVGLGGQHRLAGVGEHGVVSVGREQLTLTLRADAGLSRFTRRTISRALTRAPRALEVNAVYGIGDLGVGDPPLSSWW